jgi:large subunit ribosomal protein L30
LLPNDEGVRGKLNQVKHLVRVETLEDAEKRLAEAETKRAAREPLTVTH